MNIRVYYEDTDCGGVVYYANYLRYMERSRTELMRERGLDLGELHKQGLLFVVVEANVKYRKSAHYNDMLTVDSVIADITPVSMTFKTDICREKGDLLVVGHIKAACVNASGRAIRIPQFVHDALRQ